MMDVLKRTLLAGVGAAVITKEKVESALNEFVEKGKLSSVEARHMAEKIAEEGRREFEALRDELNERFRDRTAGSDRRAEERIEALEARVAALERAAASTRVPTSGRSSRRSGA